LPRISAVLLLLALNACGANPPRLTELDDQSNKQARSAPLVVVGVIDSDTPVGRPVPSRHDPNYPMQLHRARIQVENVLRGSIDKPTILFYYFGFGGGATGHPLGFRGSPSRRILWLRQDSGVFRTACDGQDNCTLHVESGAHPHYQPDPQKSLDYSLVDILLTRGEGEINDDRFAYQVQWSGTFNLPDHVIEKLGHLALTGPAAVKASACSGLWIYTQDRIDTSHASNAADALQAAHCGCIVKPDGNVACQ
jgi:hypothetical protein